jgi:hypothetical protein
MNPTQSKIDAVTEQLARVLDGWMPNTGTEPEVPPGHRLDVKYRRGNIVRGADQITGEFRWKLTGAGGDIVEYRVVSLVRAVGDAAPPPDAPTLLDAAAGHMRDRAATYDQPTGERSMGRAVQALNAILGRQALTESEGWLLLQVLKDVRDRQRATPHLDSLEDAIAYAALKAEARLAEGGAA